VEHISLVIAADLEGVVKAQFESIDAVRGVTFEVFPGLVEDKIQITYTVTFADSVESVVKARAELTAGQLSDEMELLKASTDEECTFFETINVDRTNNMEIVSDDVQTEKTATKEGSNSTLIPIIGKTSCNVRLHERSDLFACSCMCCLLACHHGRRCEQKRRRRWLGRV
jgi:hypothetical protein